MNLWLAFCLVITFRLSDAGYGLYFDHQRADILSWQWRHAPRTDMTFEYWIRIIDPHINFHPVLEFMVFDGYQTPAYESNYEILSSHFFDGTDFWHYLDQSTCQDSACQIVTSEVWNHVCTVWSLDGMVRHHINGTLIFENNASLTSTYFVIPLIPKGLAHIGQASTNVENNYIQTSSLDAIIDEYRIWEVARTAEEIAATWNTTVPENSPGLNLYFRFDDIGSNVVKDYGPYDHDGFLGELFNVKEYMQWDGDRAPTNPTIPRYVISQAPIYDSLGVDPVIFKVPENADSFLFSFPLPLISSTTWSSVIIIDDISAAGTVGCQEGWYCPCASLQPSYSLINTADVLRAPNNTVVMKGSVIKINETSHNFIFNPSFNFSSSVYTQVRYHTQDFQGVIQFVPLIPLTPKNMNKTGMEDQIIYMTLGTVDQDGQPRGVVIQSLPQKGSLYLPAYSPESILYPNLLQDVSMLAQIQEVPYILPEHRGIIGFKGIQYESSESSTDAYTSFSFSWILADGSFTLASNVSIILMAVNNAPINQDVSYNLTNETIVTLNSTDVDGSFSEIAYYAINSFPSLGTIESLDSKGNSYEIAQDDKPAVFAYASRVLNVSSQYSQCGEICYHPETCVSCYDQSWHATQILGEPNFYPRSGDSPNGWGASQVTFLDEWIEIGFDVPMYLSSVTVYEITRPGSITKISAASTWTGETTSWHTLWAGEAVPFIAGSRATRPSICPTFFLTKYIRIDLDVRKNGLFNLDAVEITGTLEPGRGVIPGNMIRYTPFPGIYKEDGAFDSFTFTSTDCLNQSPVPGVISLLRQNPAIVTTQEKNVTFWSTYPTNVVAQQKSVLSINVTNILADLVDKGIITSNQANVSQTTLCIVSPPNGNYQMWANTTSGKVVEIAGSNPPKNMTTLPTGSESFVMNIAPEQGTTNIPIALQVQNYSYMIQLKVQLHCPHGYFPVDPNQRCIQCTTVDTTPFTPLQLFEYQTICYDADSNPAWRPVMGYLGILWTAATTIFAAILIIFRRHHSPLNQRPWPILFTVSAAHLLFIQIPVLSVVDTPYPCGIFYWIWSIAPIVFATPVLIDAYRHILLIRLSRQKEKLALGDLNVQTLASFEASRRFTSWRSTTSYIIRFMLPAFLIVLIVGFAAKDSLNTTIVGSCETSTRLNGILLTVFCVYYPLMIYCLYRMRSIRQANTFIRELGLLIIYGGMLSVLQIFFHFVGHPSRRTADDLAYMTWVMVAIFQFRYVCLAGLNTWTLYRTVMTHKQAHAIPLSEIIATNRGYRFFHYFCTLEFSEENILAWKAIEDFRLQTSFHKLKEIYRKFVAQTAPLQVNVSSDDRVKVRELLHQFNASTPVQELQGALDFLQEALVKLMADDSYVRFKDNSLYTAYLGGAPLPELPRPTYSEHTSENSVIHSVAHGSLQPPTPKSMDELPDESQGDSLLGLKRLLQGDDRKRVSSPLSPERSSNSVTSHNEMELTSRDSGEIAVHQISSINSRESESIVSLNKEKLGAQLSEIKEEGNGLSTPSERPSTNFFPNPLLSVELSQMDGNSTDASAEYSDLRTSKFRVGSGGCGELSVTNSEKQIFFA